MLSLVATLSARYPVQRAIALAISSLDPHRTPIVSPILSNAWRLERRERTTGSTAGCTASGDQCGSDNDGQGLIALQRRLESTGSLARFNPSLLTNRRLSA